MVRLEVRFIITMIQFSEVECVKPCALLLGLREWLSRFGDEHVQLQSIRSTDLLTDLVALLLFLCCRVQLAVDGAIASTRLSQFQNLCPQLLVLPCGICALRAMMRLAVFNKSIIRTSSLWALLKFSLQVYWWSRLCFVICLLVVELGGLRDIHSVQRDEVVFGGEKYNVVLIEQFRIFLSVPR